jgi:hypothetical protein
MAGRGHRVQGRGGAAGGGLGGVVLGGPQLGRGLGEPGLADEEQRIRGGGLT